MAQLRQGSMTPFLGGCEGACEIFELFAKGRLTAERWGNYIRTTGGDVAHQQRLQRTGLHVFDGSLGHLALKPGRRSCRLHRRLVDTLFDN
jgi:hypothetical protein